MVKIVCDRCGRETYMKNPDLTGRAKIGYEEYDLCKYCILDIKRFINQGKADRKTEPSGCWVKENQGKQICDDCIKNTDCSWR